MSALYVFGIVMAEALPDPASLGPGLGGASLSLLHGAGGLAALVAESPPEPPDQTRRNMLGHTAVLERAIAVTDVLPMRFATVARDPDKLATCLDRHAGAFRGALSGIAGCVELGVKASWKEGVSYREILDTDPAIKGLRDRLQTRPSSQTYHERIELGRRVETAVEKLRETDTAMLTALLDPIAERSLALKALDENMVMNRAFLVRREQESAFDTAMRKLGDTQDERMLFRYIGPVPPYNFVTLRADWLAQAA